MIRPEVQILARRWLEPALGAGVLALGLWAATRGGWFLAAIGGAVAALGAAWMILGYRRMRFQGADDAPGMVEVDEGRISYLGPRVGGSVSLADLAEIRLLTLRGRRVWRLRQGDGLVLLVPLDAAGAAAIFDAFSTLPGLGSAALVAALTGPVATGQTLPGANQADLLVWRRQARGLTAV